MFRYNLMLAAVFFKRKIPSQKKFCGEFGGPAFGHRTQPVDLCFAAGQPVLGQHIRTVEGYNL